MNLKVLLTFAPWSEYIVLTCLIGKTMFLVLETLENLLMHVQSTGNIVSAAKIFLNLLGNIFASWEANFVSGTMFSEVGKQEDIDSKHNVSAFMFPSLPRAS